MTKPSGNKKGRPKKSDLEAVKSGNRGQVGRPAGDAAIINEYKARMLASPKSARVLETILNAALNDEHPHQAAAWKLVADRIIPVSAFDQTKNAGGTASININISGLTTSTAEIVEDITDVQVKGYSDTE
jgi:hypothetical protein